MLRIVYTLKKNWKLLSGWDYTIGNGETASNTAMAIVIKLRESIVECRVDSAKKFRPLLFMARVIANAIILAMLAFSIYTISFAVQTSETVEKTGSLFTKNQVPTIIATITNVFPMIFDLIGQIERYHPRTALRAHLTRVLVLYVLNYITFIIALFEKLDKIRDDELMKIINEQNSVFHHDDQHSISSTKFHSRNFANIKQANMFAKTSLERFSNLYQKSSEIREEMRRKRKISNTKQPSRFPAGITVESHFGPIGLNNPSALLVNKSYPWDQTRFQAIRIGPPSLPTFPIHPIPSKPTMNTSILTELGPHWQLRSKWQSPKTMILTTAATINQTSSSQSLSKMITKTTRIPWSSKRRSKLTKMQKITTPIPKLNVTATKSTIASMNISMMANTAFEKHTQRNAEISDDTVKDDTISTGKITDVTKASDTSSAANNSSTLVVTEDRMAEGISERKVSSDGSRVIILNDGYFKVPGSDNETFYQIRQKALIIAKDVEIGTNFCWETMVGQEIAKLVTMDLVITIASIFIIDFFRDLWIKYLNSWWCWNMETTFVCSRKCASYYKQSRNGMAWIIFAPLLPALNNIKLIILMYIRGWACMTCNVPAREIFRASRSSNFYLMVLLLWLLLCTLPVGYVIASKKPSSSCGPFAGYARFYNVLTQVLEGRLDRKVISWLKYIASPGKNRRKEENIRISWYCTEKTSRNNREKKKQVTYLPLVEQKRREPWRYYNGQDLDSSLCLTDETSTMTTPDSGQSSSPKHLKRKQLLPQATIQKNPWKLPNLYSTKPYKRIWTNIWKRTIMKRTIQKYYVSLQSNEWLKLDDEEDGKLESYDVESDVVEEATSEEAR
ncbi:Transmembrane channel-like protein [Dirofilaria immitis]|nr:Transmembrane channel-like protein [Dirofilaria immitis]